jgi:hypothetical protein
MGLLNKILATSVGDSFSVEGDTYQVVERTRLGSHYQEVRYQKNGEPDLVCEGTLRPFNGVPCGCKDCKYPSLWIE